MFLSDRAARCRLLIRGDDLAKSMSRYLVDQIERNDLVQVCLHSEVVELGGERELEPVTVADNRSGERTVVPARALFVFIGALPHTEWLEGHLATDKAGFLLTGDHTRPSVQYGNTPFLVGGVIIAIAFGLATTLRRSEPAKVVAASPVEADKN